MLAKAITGVPGAGGMKPAPAAGTENDLKKRRNEQPVEPQEDDRKCGQKSIEGRKHVPAFSPG